MNLEELLMMGSHGRPLGKYPAAAYARSGLLRCLSRTAGFGRLLPEKRKVCTWEAEFRL